MYLKELEIGNVKLENNIFLAPMAGITDLPFRIIYKEFGIGLVCTEMVSSKGLFYNDKKTKKLLNMENEKKPVSVQIFGYEPEVMGKSAEILKNCADIIDINMGCPAQKVARNGSGSKILKDIKLVGDIVENVVKNSKVPVTVKIRKGWEKGENIAPEVARIIEEKGASAIIVHGRSREDYFSGEVDLDSIKQVKETVKIPVIGNGDIKTEEDVVKMFEYTKCDGIMIGRASLGNPWLFRKINHYLKTNEKLPDPTDKQKLEIILKHLDILVKTKGEKTGVKEMRKFVAWYTKGMKDSAKMRDMVNKLTTKNEVDNTILEYFSPKGTDTSGEMLI